MTGLPAGTVLCGRYEIAEMIGTGGFSIVYRGRDLSLGTVVAIKELMPPQWERNESALYPRTGQNAPAWLQITKRNMRREAELITGLSGHPGIVRAYDCFEGNNTLYIVMEFAEGNSLRRYVREGRLMEEEGARVLALALLDTVEYMHGRGVIHGDIKPDNIIIGKTVKIIDFGSAFLLNGGNGGTIMGTKGYAAPEQFLGRANLGAQADLYAVGAVLYEALTGVKAPEPPGRMERNTLVAPKVHRRDMSDDLNSIIMRAMETRPQDRFQSAKEFQTALLKCSDLRKEVVTVVIAEMLVTVLLAILAVLVLLNGL